MTSAERGLFFRKMAYAEPAEENQQINRESGELPAFAEALVFCAGEEDVNGMFGGVDPSDEFLEFFFRHGCAPCCGAGASTSPDVKKDGASKPWDGLASEDGIVVGDVKFERVRVVVLAHLGFFLPSCFGLVVENAMLVVVAGGVVFKPEVAGGYLPIGKVW